MRSVQTSRRLKTLMSPSRLLSRRWGDHTQEKIMENVCTACKKPADRVNAMVVLTRDGEKYTHYGCFSTDKTDIKPQSFTRSRKPIWWTRK